MSDIQSMMLSVCFGATVGYLEPIHKLKKGIK